MTLDEHFFRAVETNARKLPEITIRTELPYERYVQRRYELDAVDIVARVRPFIIGITGSYGKSSTKSMLAHILQFKGPTLSASGSINTLMGVTRHIRDHLVFGHAFMVVGGWRFDTVALARRVSRTGRRCPRPRWRGVSP